MRVRVFPAILALLGVLGFCSPADAMDWAWENPVPAGETLYALDRGEGVTAWAAGEGGAVLFFDGTAWRYHSQVFFPFHRNLSISVLSNRDVWVSGWGKGPHAAHFDGHGWTEWGQVFPPGSTVTAVKASGPNSVWAVTDEGTVGHFNGRTWLLFRNPNRAGYRDVAEAPGGGVWLAGEDGKLVLFDGRFWQPFPASLGGPPLEDLLVEPNGTVWAVGQRGQVVSVQARTFERHPLGLYTDLLGLAQESNGSLLVSGALGALYEGDGTTWTPLESGTSRTLLALLPASDGSLWTAGEAGSLRHRQGTRWSAPGTLTTEDLLAAVPGSDGSVWAAGKNGILLHQEPSGWTAETIPQATETHALTFAENGDLWACGPSGIQRRSGSTWTVGLTNGVSWEGITPLPGGGIIAVGRQQRQAKLARFDGSTWQINTIDSSLGLYGVTARGAEIWACGEGPNPIWHFDGRHWTPELDNFTYGSFREIHAFQDGRVWAVEAYSQTLWERLGASWQPAPKAPWIQHFTVAPDETVWAWHSRLEGGFDRYNGAWEAIDTPTRRVFHALAAPGPDRLVCVGSGGTILATGGPSSRSLPPPLPTWTPTPSPTSPLWQPATPFPTETPTPVPIDPDSRPIIEEIITFGSRLTTSAGGDAGLIVRTAAGPSGSAVAAVTLAYQGTTLPLALFDDGLHFDGAAGDGVYGNAVGLPPGLPAGEYDCEVQAVNASSVPSESFPVKLVVEGSAVRALPGTLFQARMAQIPRLAAGQPASGSLYLACKVAEGGGTPFIGMVQLFWGGVGTGIYLMDDGFHEDGVAHDGIYALRIPLQNAIFPVAGAFQLDAVAYNAHETAQNRWPVVIKVLGP